MGGREVRQSCLSILTGVEYSVYVAYRQTARMFQPMRLSTESGREM